MKKTLLFIIGFFAVLFMTFQTGWAMTPLELKELMDGREGVTVIDIRNKAAYTQKHIQGSINIPSSVIKVKRLPPMGRVVVCGDGIRSDLTATAVSILNNRKGITAESLDGGFAAWESLNLTIAQKKGLGHMQFHYLTYYEFKKTIEDNSDIILVDLRVSNDELAKKQLSTGISRITPNTDDILTDIDTKFPGHKVIQPTRSQHGKKNRWDFSSHLQIKGKKSRYKKLYVLIDNGDGESEIAARQLMAFGIKRLAILTGGEQIIRRDGAIGKMVK